MLTDAGPKVECEEGADDRIKNVLVFFEGAAAEFGGIRRKEIVDHRVENEWAVLAKHPSPDFALKRSEPVAPIGDSSLFVFDDPVETGQAEASSKTGGCCG